MASLSRWPEEDPYRHEEGERPRYGEHRGEGREYGRGEYGGERPGYGREGREGYGGYGRSGQGHEIYGRPAYGRGGGYRDEERRWWDRASDEVSSWFGSEEAERRRRTDERRETRRGLGPKGYSRSNDRIREDVCDRLSDDPVVDASNIEVAVSNGEVTLSGEVDTREERRRAEECAEWVSGVTYVQNNIRVKKK